MVKWKRIKDEFKELQFERFNDYQISFEPEALDLREYESPDYRPGCFFLERWADSFMTERKIVELVMTVVDLIKLEFNHWLCKKFGHKWTSELIVGLDNISEDFYCERCGHCDEVIYL